MTTEQLYEIIQTQKEKIEDLEHDLIVLKQWSDLNDYYLREMIDALTETVNNLIGVSIEDTGGPYCAMMP